MADINDEVAGLTLAVRQLTDTVNGKLDALDARVAAAEADLNARAAAVEADNAAFKDGVLADRPALNHFADSGRFGGNDDPFDRFLSGPFVPPSYYIRANGASTPVEVGKYRFNSSDAGGILDRPMTQTTIDLVNAMPGFVNSHTIMEFYVAEITAGQGTSLPFPGATPNLFNIGNTRIYGTGPGNVFTWSYWARAIDSDIGVHSLSLVNGEADRNVITPEEGWVHVNAQSEDGRGFANHWPYIFVSPGHRVQMALPTLVSGRVSGIHASPVPSPIAAILD